MTRIFSNEESSEQLVRGSSAYFFTPVTKPRSARGALIGAREKTLIRPQLRVILL